MNGVRRVGACRVGRTARRGLSLVEVIVTLAITAALLTAVAISVNASTKAYQINQQQAALLQNSRIALTRMLATIRGAKLHAPTDATLATNFSKGQIVTGTGVDMFDDAGVEYVYKYDAPNQRIVAVVNGVVHPLLEGVVAFDVTLEPMRSATSVRTGGAWDLLRRATLLIKVQPSSKSMTAVERANPVTMTISASTMPRRNIW